MTILGKTHPTSFDDVLKGISDKSVQSLKDKLGDLWESFTVQEREGLARLLTKVGQARLEELAGKDVSDFLPVLDAALLQYQAAGQVVTAQAVTAVVQEVVGA